MGKVSVAILLGQITQWKGLGAICLRAVKGLTSVPVTREEHEAEYHKQAEV
jgi:hypothetical protein